MFPRVTASNLPRFYDQPVPSFMALQSDFCPDITPPEIMISEGLRFSSFKHLWSKNFHLLHLVFFQPALAFSPSLVSTSDGGGVG